MKVGFWYWLRAFIMTCGLVGSVIAIRKLDRTRPKMDDSASINLCPTRVTAISEHEGASIVQEGLTWYRKVNGGLEELDPIAVEKWFGRNCRIQAEFDANGATAGTPLATVAFVSGPPQVLLVTGDGMFSWMGRAFRSEELKEALKGLSDLPLRLRPSRH